jgi:hypothetical protein
MPSNAQSYFSSVNANNTAACTGAAPYGSGGHTAGLSPGATVGVAIGAAAAVAALAAIAAYLLKPALFSGIVGASAAGNTTTAGTWGGVAGQGGWSGKSSEHTSFRDSFEFAVVCLFLRHHASQTRYGNIAHLRFARVN